MICEMNYLIDNMANLTNLSTNDYLLLSQFKTWRFGYQSRVTKNEVLDGMLYNSFNRSYREVWAKAEECEKQCESKDLKTYFHNIAEKFKNKTLYRL